MLLTITTTYQPATDLGYLLYKHPAKVQTFDLNFGKAHVFYPEATPERCTAALLLDIDPVGLVRGSGAEGFGLKQYVNDRPYVASSFLSVALAQVYSSALAGVCKERPTLVQTALPLEARLDVVPCDGGEALLQRLFAPLGYTLTVTRHPLDETFPTWGESNYYAVTLAATTPLAALLAHLYVLIPVLDDEKHYYVGADEIDKLLKHGEGWLAAHPERDLITARYLKHRYTLQREALARLMTAETPQVDEEIVKQDAAEAILEETADTKSAAKVSLHAQRLDAVLEVLKNSGAQRVLDLGCGEGRLLALLLKEKNFQTILGADVSYRALEVAADRLHLDRLPPKQRTRINLLHSSLLYRDPRLAGFDAAAIVEVIEHLDAPRLAAFERVVFEFARPGTVVITTPNAEYNVLWATLPAGHFRHKDHRFEWTRAEFERWAQGIAERFGYAVRFVPIGPEAADLGAPSQMGVFTLL